MIRPGFLTSSERLELVACVRSHREDHGVARRANAILLLDDGKSCQAIAEFLYLDDDTIRGWYKTYREGGWDALSTDGWKGGQSRMTAAQETELCAVSIRRVPQLCGLDGALGLVCRLPVPREQLVQA
jgi:transposase